MEWRDSSNLRSVTTVNRRGQAQCRRKGGGGWGSDAVPRGPSNKRMSAMLIHVGLYPYGGRISAERCGHVRDDSDVTNLTSRQRGGGMADEALCLQVHKQEGSTAQVLGLGPTDWTSLLEMSGFQNKRTRWCADGRLDMLLSGRNCARLRRSGSQENTSAYLGKVQHQAHKPANSCTSVDREKVPVWVAAHRKRRPACSRMTTRGNAAGALHRRDVPGSSGGR